MEADAGIWLYGVSLTLSAPMLVADQHKAKQADAGKVLMPNWCTPNKYMRGEQTQRLLEDLTGFDRPTPATPAERQ
ncbi:MAG: hypothetical protein FJ392_04705 [Verrucomicrobia bacterium]|nr:hypothetical protein [Verrucomicrobiota bacterium]